MKSDGAGVVYVGIIASTRVWLIISATQATRTHRLRAERPSLADEAEGWLKRH
jgi:hypothetical protein